MRFDSVYTGVPGNYNATFCYPLKRVDKLKDIHTDYSTVRHSDYCPS